ncbi:MAG: PfkB family carbohydrate kinase [Pyrinomonadaceae bacterium]
MPTAFTVIGLGELIWDLLPTGKQLGGAPTNFAYNAHLLGNDAVVASRIGPDSLGREAVTRLAQMGLDASFMQRDDAHPTGTVGVTLAANGEPTFAMNEDSAWDYLTWTPRWAELAARADTVCFGTLGQRAAQARATIDSFLAHTQPRALRIFDVNLRHSFFTPDMLAASLRHATVVKLNSDELTCVAAMLDTGTHGQLQTARHLLRAFNLQLVAVTRGAAGSLLVTQTEAIEHAGLRVRCADTIGAGDAFAAALAHGLLRSAPLAHISAAANRIGAWVATQTGATPPPDAELLTDVRELLN